MVKKKVEVDEPKGKFDLAICESPNKVKHIQQYAPKGTVVKASVGHITKIADVGLYNLGIDVTGDFDVCFEVDDKKKEVVKELKELVKRADTVWLFSDSDAEGEAISWHLKETLKIPNNKYKRITTDEITQKGVTDAFAHPRKINQSLVDAAIGRACLDKIIGYRLSTLARRKVGAKSVGRCQSAALKIICDREKEILAFNSKTFYEVWLTFTKDNKDYKAQYKGLLKAKKNTSTIESEAEADKIVEDCKGYTYTVHLIENKDRNVAAKLPFTTSTYQQEVANRFGYSVKKAQQIAQELFEMGRITYIRTDSVEMAEEFVDSAKQLIETNYGRDYFTGKKKAKKTNNVQGAHECIRPTDLSMTPDKFQYMVNDQQMAKIYALIYARAVASLMKDAIITDTTFTIKNGDYKFEYIDHTVKEQGWRKAYGMYDDEELTEGLDVCVGEKLEDKSLDKVEKKTSPPRRYSQATLISKLGSLGIGRPSTTATIISTILDPQRGYCVEQGKALCPTDKGMLLSKYLDEAFPDVINYDYSAKLEADLDLIATGKLNKLEFLKEFYFNLCAAIKKSNGVTVEKPPVEEVGRACPDCGKPLIYRQGRNNSKFIGCSGWRPYNKGCNHTEKC